MNLLLKAANRGALCTYPRGPLKRHGFVESTEDFAWLRGVTGDS